MYCPCWTHSVASHVAATLRIFIKQRGQVSRGHEKCELDTLSLLGKYLGVPTCRQTFHQNGIKVFASVMGRIPSFEDTCNGTKIKFQHVDVWWEALNFWLNWDYGKHGKTLIFFQTIQNREGYGRLMTHVKPNTNLDLTNKEKSSYGGSKKWQESFPHPVSRTNYLFKRPALCLVRWLYYDHSMLVRYH